MHRQTLVLAGLLLLAPTPSWATGLVDCFNSSQDRDTLSAGQCATWTETGTTDSDVFYARDGATCVNTGSTDFTVYQANRAGTKLHIWVGPVQDGVSCSPNSGNTTCGAVSLDPGFYVMDPDATAASALCIGGTVR